MAADLLTHVLRQGDRALVLSHRLAQWITRVRHDDPRPPLGIGGADDATAYVADASATIDASGTQPPPNSS